MQGKPVYSLGADVRAVWEVRRAAVSRQGPGHL